ncbi:uncharacterized protein LOC122278665 [Carya illinoinensis]|uniref:uncharacterized protein LOC122278665 n=1 Tax=Carya illinoinensis TaxID=32201 RepID=UPI001C7208C3|nr:uncharacterized protein LOC122278665 [Carya illinoinensis]
MFGNNLLTTDQVIQHALTLYQEHTAVHEAQQRKQKYSCKWQPPPVGSLKLNVDGATFSDQCRSGIGVVLRDDKGKVTFAASKPEDAIADPMEIELIAILRGIQLCIPLGIVELQIESDALLVIEELKKDGKSSTLWSSLIHEIKTLLSSFPAWSIQYRGRESNGVAHNLAKFAWHLDDIALWWDVIPECISHAIWVDSSL